MNYFMRCVAVLGLAVFLLLNVACPEGCHIVYYDVTGVWKIERTIAGKTDSINFRFYGTRDSGEVYWDNYFIGNYAYEDGALFFQIKLPDNVDFGYKTYLENYEGAFDNKDHLGGKLRIFQVPNVIEGVWSATRVNSD